MIIEKLLSLQKTKAAKIVLYAYKYNGINQVKDMKKMMALAVGATLLLSSCSSYTGAGAYTGAQFGSILGSAIGGISGGPRGSDIGTIVGMAGGAMVGATIGNAADHKAHGKMDNDYPSNRGDYDSSNSGYDSSNSGFDSTNSGDDRIDFDGGDAATGNYEYKQPSSPADNVYTHSAPTMEIRNARFIDADGDDTISRGEMCKVVFEVYNNGLQPVYNVVPTVAEMTGNKHIYISQPISVEKIGAYKGVRYTAMVKADNRLKYGTIKLCCSVLQNGEAISKVTEFNIEARKKKIDNENKSTNIDRQEVSRALCLDNLALLSVGICTSHPRCIEQAFPKLTRHFHNPVVVDSGDNIFRIFPYGNTCRVVYQSPRLQTRSGVWTCPLCFWSIAFYPRLRDRNLLCLSWSAIYNRLRTRVLGDSCQPLCSRTWR